MFHFVSKLDLVTWRPNKRLSCEEIMETRSVWDELTKILVWTPYTSFIRKQLFDFRWENFVFLILTRWSTVESRFLGPFEPSISQTSRWLGPKFASLWGSRNRIPLKSIKHGPNADNSCESSSLMNSICIIPTRTKVRTRIRLVALQRLRLKLRAH